MDKRFLSAIALFFVFFLGWNYMGQQLGIVKQVPVEEVENQQNTINEAQSEPSSLNEPVVGNISENLDPRQDQEEQEDIDRQTVLLKNDHVTFEVDNKGGIVKTAVLDRFYQTVNNQEKVSLIASRRHFPGEILLETTGIRTADWMFHVEQSNANQVTLSVNRNGYSIIKTYHLDKKYNLNIDVEVSKNGNPVLYKMIVGEGLQPVTPEDVAPPSLLSFGAISAKLIFVTWSENGDHEEDLPSEFESSELKKALEEENFVEWFGLKDTYFANVFLPNTPHKNFKAMTLEHYVDKEPISTPVVALESKQSISGSFYMGPIEEADLIEADPKLANLLSYGWAGLLSKWLFLLLEFCHKLTGNWGWAIIITTCFIRLLLLPLMIPGMKSSIKMKEIQPKIAKLKEKFPGDDFETKQKLSQETWKIYQKEGVNPFSSCIMMLPQMPIFFAYFSLLRTSIALRQSEWMFWVDDLSRKDGTYILPIIMAATMYVSQLATPMPSTDPTQQRMMKIMPVAISVMFIAMPSGLILYMITSNVFTMGQSYLLRKRYSKK